MQKHARSKCVLPLLGWTNLLRACFRIGIISEYYIFGIAISDIAIAIYDVAITLAVLAIGIAVFAINIAVFAIAIAASNY